MYGIMIYVGSCRRWVWGGTRRFLTNAWVAEIRQDRIPDDLLAASFRR